MGLQLIPNFKGDTTGADDFWISWTNCYNWRWMIENALNHDIERWSNDEGSQRFTSEEAIVIAEHVEGILAELQGDTWYAYPLEERALHCENERGEMLPPDEAQKILDAGGAIREQGAFSRERLDEFAKFCRRSRGFGVY